MAGKELSYTEYVTRKLPQTKIAKIDFDFIGDPFNDIVTVNDNVIFKFSKYDWTGFYLENEVNVVSFLRDYVSMPLPGMELAEKGVAKHSIINGVPLTRDKLYLLGFEEQNKLAEQIGVFLNEIHSIPLKILKSGNIGESPNPLFKNNRLSEYEQLRQKIYPYCDSYTRGSVDLIFKTIAEDDCFHVFQPALVHAALLPQNILYDEENKQINGVTGFGFSGIGDPAYDISVLLSNYGEAFAKRVNKYCRITEEVINRARFYAFWSRLDWMKKVSDMIACRDFTQLRFSLNEGDIMPIGCGW